MRPGKIKSKRPPITSGQRRWGLFKFVLFTLFLIMMAMVGGFLEFTRQVGAQERPNPVPQADGIVVWTGPGGGRLSAGTDLLAAEKGERLLISGVNPQNSREEMTELLGLSESEQACCLDLDYAAIDTVGNAHETAMWAQALGYEHIILVTSDYHMPRAQIEITAAAGRIRITRYPVKSEKDGPWWRDNNQRKRLTREYGKLLGSFMRRPRDNDTNTNSPVVVPEGAEPNAGDNSDAQKADE